LGCLKFGVDAYILLKTTVQMSLFGDLRAGHAATSPVGFGPARSDFYRPGNNSAAIENKPSNRFLVQARISPLFWSKRIRTIFRAPRNAINGLLPRLFEKIRVFSHVYR
jgi:hypothetical protein